MHDLEAFGENLLYLKDLVDVSWVYRRELCICFEVPGVGWERKGFLVLFIDGWLLGFAIAVTECLRHSGLEQGLLLLLLLEKLHHD